MTQCKEWFVFYVRYNHEKKVHKQLLANGLASYLPVFEKIKQWSDRKKKISEPMFPCYLFVHCELKDIYAVLTVNGVVGFVINGKERAKLKESEIELIRKIEAKPDEIRVNTQTAERGKKVQIESGTFAGHTGEILQFEDGKKMILLLELFGTKVVTTLASVQVSLI